jgi:hypothetical protein
VLLAAPAVVAAQAAKLQLDHLNRLASKASETVDVTLDESMLKLSAGLLASKDADAAKFQQVIQGITGVYVKSFKFNTAGAYTDADVEEVRKQVARAGWSRIVGVREKDELNEVYLWKDGGVVVISAERDELTVVNIVGSIELSELHEIEGRFGVPKVSGR